MKSTIVLGIGATLLASCSGNKQKTEEKGGQQRPNVIFLIADDIGYGDLSCNGSKTILFRWGIAEERLNMDIYGSPFYISNQELMKKKDGQLDPFDRWYVDTRSFEAGQDRWPIPLAETNINPNLR